MKNWNPSYEGKLGELPRILKPLEPFKDDIMMLGNLTHNGGRALLDGAGDHGRCCGSYLTGIQVKKTTSISRRVSPWTRSWPTTSPIKTRFPSLELGMEDARQAGDCDSGYSCAYTNNLAWRSETQPLPPILDPKTLFERLFGNGAHPQPRSPRPPRPTIAAASSTSSTRIHASSRPASGPTDQRKLDEYLSSIREVEKQIEKAEKTNAADRSAHGKALRRPGRFRRALQAHDRHDHHRVPGRPDARRDFPDDP